MPVARRKFLQSTGLITAAGFISGNDIITLQRWTGRSRCKIYEHAFCVNNFISFDEALQERRAFYFDVFRMLRLPVCPKQFPSP